MGQEEFAKTTAVIGAGKWGKNLIRNLHNLGALSCIFDRSESVLDRYEKDYPDVTLTSNVSTVLETSLIQRLVISSSATSHFELAKQGLEAGKDVYVEKPLCLNTYEAQVLIDLAASKKRILMTGHLLQYHPAFQALLKHVREGKVGKPQYIFSNRMDLGFFRTEENALWNFAPHDLSMILALCNDRLPSRVNCTGSSCIHEGIVDNSSITMHFDEGLQAHIYCSWINPYKEQRLTVWGTEGAMVFDDTQDWDQKLCLYQGMVERGSNHIATHSKREGTYIPIAKEEPLRNECIHFLTCCETRQTPISDGLEALRVLKVVQAAQESMEAGNIPKDPEEVHQALINKELIGAL